MIGWNDRGALAGLTLVVLVIELIFFLFNYYDVYQDVFPGSTVAKNLAGGGGTAFEIFKWMICWCSGAFTVPLGGYLGFVTIKALAQSSTAGTILAFIFALPIFAVGLFVGSWQMWIYWMWTPVWTNSVWNHACDTWDGYALLQGITWGDVSSSLPFVGVATVFLASGNYSMQLERNNRFHNTFTFYDLQTGNITPLFDNITYDTIHHTYTIKNVTTHYTLDPNLAFPSLDMELADNSIPFDSDCGYPAADILYHNGSVTSNVLNTVNTNYDDCTQLKMCVMSHPEGDFEIAMGVVMIQQYLYGVCCTTPSDSDSGD